MPMSKYPLKRSQRKGLLLPEEAEVQTWVRQSEFKLADDDFDCDNDWTHPDWIQWACPFRLMYEAYRRWKLPRPVNHWDPDCPLLLSSGQFGALLQVLYPDLKAEHYGTKRRSMRYLKGEDGKRRGVLVYRGIKHPDAVKLRTVPGRPSHAEAPED